MKTYKITKGNKQYIIKAKDTYSAVVKLRTILKDQKQIAKFIKSNNGDIAEGFIMETNKGFTFTSPQNPKDDKDFSTQKLAEIHANKLGYVKDNKPIKDSDKDNEQERNKKIQQFANKTGLSFIDAKRMLEEIESGDDSYYEKMSEMLRDDRLSPMTYKKLKEMGYNSDKWANLTQEEANKIVAKSETSSKPKTETPKQETKQSKNNSGAVKSEPGNSINPDLVKKYPNLHKDLGNLASANKAVRSLCNSNNVEDRERGYALSNKIAAYLDKHYSDTLGDNLGADSLLDAIGDEDKFEKVFLDILENGKPKDAPEKTESTQSENASEKTESTQPEEGPSKELQKLLTHKPTANFEAAIKHTQALWNQIDKDIAKRGSNVVKASDGSDYTFDITDGSSYSKAYKAALAGAPVKVNGYEAKIENLTPDEYLRACAKQKGQTVEQLIKDRKDKSYTNLVKELGKSKTINNSIWLDQSSLQQEGIHRAMALKKLGVKTIPTLVVSNKRVPYNQSDKYLSFNK